MKNTIKTLQKSYSNTSVRIKNGKNYISMVLSQNLITRYFLKINLSLERIYDHCNSAHCVKILYKLKNQKFVKNAVFQHQTH